MIASSRRDDPHKRCSRCGKWLPFAAFPRNPRLKSGFDSWCRECKAEAAKRWRAGNPEYVDAYNLGRRVGPSRLTCSECGVEFDGRRDRLVCSRACRDRRYRRLHPEQVRENESRKAKRRRERQTSEP
jgi:hypothetical protein